MMGVFAGYQYLTVPQAAKRGVEEALDEHHFPVRPTEVIVLTPGNWNDVVDYALQVAKSMNTQVTRNDIELELYSHNYRMKGITPPTEKRIPWLPIAAIALGVLAWKGMPSWAK